MSQVINCARALKAVNFRAINCDEPVRHIAESCEKVKGKETYLCFYLLQDHFICRFLFVSVSTEIIKRSLVCVCMCADDRLVTILRHHNFLKELHEIAVQGESEIPQIDV